MVAAKCRILTGTLALHMEKKKIGSKPGASSILMSGEESKLIISVVLGVAKLKGGSIWHCKSDPWNNGHESPIYQWSLWM